MPKKVRVNIRSVANSKLARKETRNGRDLLIIPSATLPDDIVMNGIKYPASEIEASYKTLNRTPAPNGHPIINGQFVSASDPEGINLGYIGAWNENARRENGRVFLDKIIDVEIANRSDAGKAVLSAIDDGEPIHTSTGLLCELEPAGENDGHKFVARNMYFDHDAILVGEEGAATPEQGVGMLVNGKEIEIVNSSAEDVMRDLDWAVESAVRAMEKLDNIPLYDRIKAAILEAFAPEREISANKKEAEMADDKKLEELSAKVNTLSETVDKIGDTIAEAVKNAVKPLTDNLTEIQANQKSKDDAELAGLVNKLVETGQWTKEDCEGLTLNALRKLVDNSKPGKAATVNGNGAPGKDDEWAGYDLNANINDAKDKEAA